jgi:hypothetical protein
MWVAAVAAIFGGAMGFIELDEFGGAEVVTSTSTVRRGAFVTRRFDLRRGREHEVPVGSPAPRG